MSDFKLPADVKSSLIQVLGRSFWYKQPLFEIFARSGIPENLYLKYEHEPKFKIGRQLLDDLEGLGEDGFLLQKRLLTELCKLRGLPDSGVPDRDAGLAALRELKMIATEHDLITKEEVERGKRRASDSEILVQKARDRQRRLAELYDAFCVMSKSPDHQARGYSLEDLLKELFALFEIRYRKSYRADGEQIDGFFTFGGFDYLVEARWRRSHLLLMTSVPSRVKLTTK